MNARITNLMPSPAGTGVVLTVDDTATSFAAGAFPENTRYVMWEVQTAPIAVTFDGGDPEGSGPIYVLEPGRTGWWSRAAALAVRAVRTTGDDGAIAATPFTD